MNPDVTEVGPGVFHVAASHTNAVLVHAGDEVTLIDTGYPRDRALLRAAVERTGRSLGDITGLVLTHAHVDHLGSAEWLRREQGLPVRCHADEAAHARGEDKQVISEFELLRRLYRPGVLRFTLNAVRAGGARFDHPAEVSTFDDGEELAVPGRPVAVHTPGHTSGHVAFHLPDRGVLCSGDALITVDVWDRSRTGPQLIRPQFNHDHEQARRSLDRLAELDAELIVPGHGEPYRGGPGRAVDEARRREAA